MHEISVSPQPPANSQQFTVLIPEGSRAELPLDQVVFTRREVQGHERVRWWGIVESNQMSESYTAHVRVLRRHPDVAVPPGAFEKVWLADSENVAWALRFTDMRRRIPAGLLASGDPAYLNLDFLSGARGGHLNISGMSGMATKTSYALFLLYALLHGPTAARSRAIVFNVKGDGLLHLHEPNPSLSADDEATYKKLGLPVGPFPEVQFHATDRPLWTLHEFARRELIRFLFTEDQTEPAQFAVDTLAGVLRQQAEACSGPELVAHGTTYSNFAELSQAICQTADQADNPWYEKTSASTRLASVRRLRALTPQVSQLIGPEATFNYDHPLNVVDLHRLSQRASAFVVGAVLKTLFERREQLGPSHPTVYLLVDELNKYAPSTDPGPIGKLLVDVAERGRSLGIVLLGAQQAASSVQDRVVSNAAIRVAGRLDAGESRQDEYAWLSPTMRERATDFLPGTMALLQPEIPVPLVVRFPFPCWASQGKARRSPPAPPV